MISFSFIFTKLGNLGPIILYLITNYLLWDKPITFYYYQVGFVSSAILNLVLKGIFKQPRPSEDLKQFNLAIKNGHRFIFKNGIPHDIFGMPSGHSLTSIFTTVFIFLSLKDLKLFLGFLLMSLLIMSERIVDNYHTLFQVIVGASVGALYAYLFYYFSETKLKGKIEEKPDDNGPL